jgi:aspartokinase/homoserine dehydrogenase 1
VPVRTLVMKFGGTSVGSVDAIRQVTGIVRQACEEQAERVAIVVSAMSGVTDLLQRGVTCAMAGDGSCYRGAVGAVLERHREAARTLLGGRSADVMSFVAMLIETYRRFCESIEVLGEVTPRALDYTMGLGERMNARLVAAALREAGIDAEAVDATDLIMTDDQHQNAAPLFDRTGEQVAAVLDPMLDRGTVPVITGFIGATEDGIPTTLGRGGSDYSATIIAVGLGADEVWIWTDVDGVMSADPRVVPDACTIERLTYLEVGELAYFGAKVLHPRSIRPVVEAGIPLRVKNTFNPEHAGTLLVPNDHDTGQRVKAVTAIRDMSLITVEGKGMLGVPGIAARTFGAVARAGTSVLMISQSSSEQSISFVVPQHSAARVARELGDEFDLEIRRHDIDRISALDGVTIITVVGAGMREVPGIAGRVFTATGDHDVNVIAIAQGSSEVNISLVVRAEDGDRALRAIHPLTQPA